MSYKVHMKGYEDLRTLAQTERLYAWKHDRYFPPALVEINPTNMCNQQCRYCYTNKRVEAKETVSDDLLMDSFSQVADAGVQAIVIQGTGEPLMHRGLTRAIENGARNKLAMGLCTNGILLNDALQERILEHLLYIRFSVLECSPERYAYLHGCSEKQWTILVDNIRKAVKRRDDKGLQLGLCITVYLYQGNFRHVSDIVKFYKDLGIDYIFIQEATYTDYSPAGKEEPVSKNISETEIQEMKHEAMLLSDDECRVKIKFPANEQVSCGVTDKMNWREDFCQGMKFYTIISCDGGVYPCWRAWGRKEFSYGSLYEQRFEEIWKSEKRKAIENLLLKTPPFGDECMNCNNAKVNEILESYQNANTRWKDFVL